MHAFENNSMLICHISITNSIVTNSIKWYHNGLRWCNIIECISNHHGDSQKIEIKYPTPIVNKNKKYLMKFFHFKIVLQYKLLCLEKPIDAHNRESKTYHKYFLDALILLVFETISENPLFQTPMCMLLRECA